MFDIASDDWLNPTVAYEVITAYYRSKQAYGLARMAAEAGDPEAQYFLASFRRMGVQLLEDGWELVEHDEAGAMKLMRMAADGGNPEAQAEYGRILLLSKQIYDAELKFPVFKKELNDSGAWALDEIEYADGLEYLAKAAYQGSGYASFWLVSKVYNLRNHDDGSQLGPLNLAKAEQYCELSIRKAFPLFGGYCAGELGLGYSKSESPYGQDYYASAYWLALLQNRLRMENLPADKLISFKHYLDQLPKSKSHLTELQIAELEEAARIAVHPACGNAYYRARHGYSILCPGEES